MPPRPVTGINLLNPPTAKLSKFTMYSFSSLGWSGNECTNYRGLLYQPQIMDDDDDDDDDDDECGALGVMLGRGNQNIFKKPAPVLLCPLQNPQDLIRARTQYAEVGNQELTV
jgi:hypothetical protein